MVAKGPTIFSNLALACIHCSLRKGAKQTGRDPASGATAKLFNPRGESWNHHFRWIDLQIVGITASGRATIAALGLNNSEHLIIRYFELTLGRHPPPGHV
jgi:hypothetical protein